MVINDNVKIVKTNAGFDCGGMCPLRLHVKDGKIIRVEGDGSVNDPDEQLRACLRCRAIRQYVYHPKRLKYPLKRAGPKGSGQFKRISWDEALDTVAIKLKETIAKYGNTSIFCTAQGFFGSLHDLGVYYRLINQIGGCTTNYGNISSQGCVFGVQSTYGFGAIYVGHSREDWMNSKLIILWGMDPSRMISGTNTTYWLIKARENGAKVVLIDPRYSDTGVVAADQWIPIIPGTDVAMMLAMAYVILKNNLQDQEFLDKYTYGFDKFRAYVMGDNDGVPKTPEWAEKICGVKASIITDLAKEYATVKPAALEDCQGPARSPMGGQYTKAAITLTAMTGNIGKHGGSACGGLHGIPYGHVFRNATIPGVRNTAYPKKKSLRGNINVEERLTTRFHINKLGDAFLKGKKGGYPADIKFALFAGANFLNQTANCNKFAKALQREDLFTVVSELWMTSTAKYADIVLPVTSFAERSDLTRPWPSGPCFGYINKAIDPIGECKDDIEIVEELAKRLGIKNFHRENIIERYISNLSSQDKDEIGKIKDINDKFLRAFTLVFPELKRHIKNYPKYKEDSIHRVELEEPYVAFKAQIEDPENNPFPTPSGKIEIYSDQVASWNNPNCPPIPKYISTFENRNDPLIEKHPLQLITPHARNRVHSQFYEVEWLREAFPHKMWINPLDAKSRGVKSGDMCLVFNDRGTVAIEAWETKRIIPGVVAIPEGAWYTPDENGIDRGACVNTLTKDAYTEGGGACTLKHPLVQVKKEEVGI